MKEVIEEKISSKLNEIIQEFKIEKGRSITKLIDESAKKIAKIVAKKIKKEAKNIASENKANASRPVKAKTKGTPNSLAPAKPALKKTKVAVSPKPISRRKKTTAPIKNQPQSKSRIEIPKKLQEKAILT